MPEILVVGLLVDPDEDATVGEDDLTPSITDDEIVKLGIVLDDTDLDPPNENDSGYGGHGA